MPILPVNIGEKFASKTLKKFYGKAVAPEICNTDYEPIASVGGTDRVHILSFLNNPSLTDYTPGTDMNTETWMGDIEDDLLLDQKKYFDFEIDDLNKFEAYVDDLDSNLLESAAGVLQQRIDSFVLQLGSNNVKAGHRVGSDAMRDSFIVSAAGALLGAADDALGGRIPLDAASLGLKFASSDTWYRISAVTDSSHATLTDWNGSTYSGGAKTQQIITIEAYTSVTVTTSTIYAKIVDLATKLNKDDIPTDNRYLVVHPDIGADLRQATELIPAVPVAYEKVVENGLLGYISGFKVYESPRIRGDNTNGYFCIAGHKSFITFAHTWKESRVVQPDARFAKRYQGLNVWGAKVPIERRKAGALLFCKT